MRYGVAYNIKLLATVLAISILLLFSANTIQAAVMPLYERLQPITSNLNAPTAVALDVNEWIYVTEPSYNRLNIYSPSSHFIKSLSGLDKPIGVAVDSSGRIFVGNSNTGNVEVYDADFTLLFKLGSGDGEFTKPCAIAIDIADNIYVADCEEDKIKVYNSNGSFNFSFGGYGSGDGLFNFPSSIAIDKIAGELIISDHKLVSGMTGSYQSARIQVFDMNGVFKRSFGVRGTGDGKLIKPMGVAVDRAGRIYVTDAYQGVVEVFDTYGVYLGAIYDLTNPLRTPLGIAVGKSNRLFIVSHITGKIELYGIDAYTQMEVTPLSLYFEGHEGGTNPPLQSLDIKNNGTEVLNWTASTNESWLTLSQTSGARGIGGISTIDVGVDLTGLLAGTYTGTIEISAESGATEAVGITLTVTPPPVLSVTPSSLEFTSLNGSIPPSQALSIENTGEGTLNWSASSDRTRILLDKNSGIAPDIINVSVDISLLGEGTHTGNITVTGEQGVLGSPAIIPVTLNIVVDKGAINVITNLSQATFTINGPASYSGSGTSWSVTDAPIGTYTIIFGDVQGYTTPPSETQTLQKDGTITFSGQYEMRKGAINVITNLSQATFTINGPASYSGSGTSWSVTDAPIGTYTIIFGDVQGSIPPPSETQTLQENSTITFTGQYIIKANIIVGAGYGESNSGLVKIFNPDGSAAGVEFIAHKYTYGVNVAAGDINGDGYDDIITAPGPGEANPAEINIFDRNGNQLSGLSFTAFTYNYGANVASADFDGDGYYEVVAGAGAGRENHAHVKVFVYDPGQQTFVDSGISFLPYGTKVYYGVNVATGDVDGDGIPEIITTPGPGPSYRGDIRIWKVDTSSGTGQWSTSLIKEFTAQTEYKYSVTIASADVNGDGYDEIITGDGPAKPARDVITVYDKDGTLITVWQAGTSFDGYGAHVASGDIDMDGVAEIIVAPGPGPLNISFVKIFDAYGYTKGSFYPFYLPYGANLAVGRLGLEGVQ